VWIFIAINANSSFLNIKKVEKALWLNASKNALLKISQHRRGRALNAILCLPGIC
jgi:hypothetical protein